jgi:hypothetical protein
LNPGTYIINKGGMHVDAGTTLSGAGITFYNTSTNAGGGGYQPFTINGGATLNISAPTSGPFEGILFFADRSMLPVTNVINGNSASNIVGALYFPKSYLSFSGNNSSTAYTMIVADLLTITGNATINNDYSSLTNGSPIRNSGAMVE